MNFKDLVVWVRSQGCKVTVYKKKKKIDGCFGVFDEDPEPNIKIATKNSSIKKSVSVLLHEYAHFLQWREGFSQYLVGICWPHQVFTDWIDRDVELTEREIKIIRNTMLFVEYDADMRSYEIGITLKPDGFNAEYHLKESYSYAICMKWGWKHRKDWKKRPNWRLWPSKRLTHKELFAVLTKKQKEILKKIKIKKRK